MTGQRSFVCVRCGQSQEIDNLGGLNTREAVLKVLADGEPHLPLEVAKSLGFTWDTWNPKPVIQLHKALANEGLIEWTKSSPSAVRLTAAGMKAVEGQ